MTAIANVTSIDSRRVLRGAAATIDGSQHASDSAAAGVSTHHSDATHSVKLRLTRRGRVVFGTLGVALVAGVLAIVAMLAAPGAVASDESGASEFPYVLVGSGDSLWGIAQDLDPAADARDVVAEIVRLNQLHSSELQAGEVIAVPMRFSDNQRIIDADA